MPNSTLSTTVKSQIHASLQNISTLGQIRGHKDTGWSNSIFKYIQETIQLRKITSRRWSSLEVIGSTKKFLKYRLIEPTNNREAKLRERGDASQIPVRVHWESKRGNPREASVSRVAFAFDKRVQVQFPNFPACHSSRRGRSLEYSSTTLRFLFLGLIPSAATLPSAQPRRLFKIPAGVPSSVLKITPTRLVCRFGPSLVDCDIALALLATSATPIPDSPHPYFIRAFSTFPPCFCPASTPSVSPLHLFAFVPFSRPSYSISRVSVYSKDEKGRSFSRNFSRPPWQGESIDTAVTTVLQACDELWSFCGGNLGPLYFLIITRLISIVIYK